MLITDHVRTTEADVAVATEPVTRPTLTIAPEQMDELRTTAQMLASTDPAFRAALVQNPGETLASLIHMNSGAAYELQKTIKVIALEQAEDTVLVVIPSPDKAVVSNSALAKVSLEVANNPELRSTLLASPREVLEGFLKANGDEASALPSNKTIKVVLEDGGEFIVVAPQTTSPSTISTTDGELLSAGKFETHMSCITCHCITNSMCITGQCVTASGCITWSSNCK